MTNCVYSRVLVKNSQVYESPSQLWEAVARNSAGGDLTSAGASLSVMKSSDPNYPSISSPNCREEEQNVPMPRWYSDAVAYWDAQEPSDNGVLGGHGHLSKIDIQDSESFLLKVMGSRFQSSRDSETNTSPNSDGTEQAGLVALDCGAGVGRVSAGLLLQYFHEVDLIEPSSHLLEAAKKRLCGSGAGKNGTDRWPQTHRAVGFFKCGLEEFDPEPQRYDVIWIQWALLYLTDGELYGICENYLCSFAV